MASADVSDLESAISRAAASARHAAARDRKGNHRGPMLTIRALSDGGGYSSRHLENRDYYTEGERVTGQWRDRASELLELSGEVKTTDFESLCQGLDLRTGQSLRQRHSTDRVASDGTTQSRGRHQYDFTISARKSVSIMAVLGEDERLIEAHANAVAEALGELQRFAAGRVRQSGANIVTVKSVDKQGRIQLLDGRTLPDNYKQFAHGYAVTAHRSQGKKAICALDPTEGPGNSMSKPLAAPISVLAAQSRLLSADLLRSPRSIRRSACTASLR